MLVLSPVQLETVNGPYHIRPVAINHSDPVERWRPLVERHFAAGDVGTALRIIGCESGGDPDAKNAGSSAAGLFQFLKGTWDWVAPLTGSPSYVQGGPYDPEWAVINAAVLAEDSWTHWNCY